MFKFLRRLILVLFVLFAGYKIYQVHHDVKQVMKYPELSQRSAGRAGYSGQ